MRALALAALLATGGCSLDLDAIPRRDGEVEDPDAGGPLDADLDSGDRDAEPADASITPDASLDAGATDASVTPDASLDAGATDAGDPDAG